MSDYALHPEALADIDEIWEYIASDNVDAADRAPGAWASRPESAATPNAASCAGRRAIRR